MKFFGIGREKRDRFVSADDQRKNLRLQRSMTRRTLEQLSSLGVSVDSKLKVEFFFS